MIAFPSQSKIAANPWINIIVDNTGRNNKISHNVVIINKEKSQNTSTNIYNSNIPTCAFEQNEKPPLFENFALGTTQIITSYILYSISIGFFSVADFLRYVLIFEQTPQIGQAFAVFSLFWVGVAMIMVMVWGKTPADLGPVTAISCSIILIVVILPMILLWWLGPLSILDKFVWMAWYLTMLRFMSMA